MVEAREGVDLVVAPGADVAEALRLDPASVLLEGGRPETALRAAGMTPVRYLALPGFEQPEFLLPLGDAQPLTHALERWLVPRARWKRVRNRVLGRLFARGIVPPGRAVLTVASKGPRKPPFLVAAATELGVPADATWFVGLGGGDVLARGVFQVFAPGAREPGWALKFARVPGYAAAFDRDERGLHLAQRAGATAAAHAPKLLGRFECGGFHGSVETAATGERLNTFLASERSRAEKLAAVDAVAEWILALARESATSADALEPVRRQLAEEVLPRWRDYGAPADLVDRLPPVPAVFRRGDLATWNVLFDRGSFVAIDWEDAQEAGPPLWDLFFFLTDALAILDGVSSDAERDEHSRRLWRGELPSSERLFEWTRRAVDELELPVESVGPLATLLWLSVGLEHLAHLELADSADLESGFARLPVMRMARLWLEDPQLGPAWGATAVRRTSLGRS